MCNTSLDGRIRRKVCFFWGCYMHTHMHTNTHWSYRTLRNVITAADTGRLRWRTEKFTWRKPLFSWCGNNDQNSPGCRHRVTVMFLKLDWMDEPRFARSLTNLPSSRSLCALLAQLHFLFAKNGFWRASLSLEQLLHQLLPSAAGPRCPQSSALPQAQSA